jgi:peptidyl-prolyl cis-trans isomerase C
MKFRPLVLSAAIVLAGAVSAASAQNIAVVNGKAVPKARVDSLMKQVSAQAAAQGQQLPPDIDQRARDKVVLDEIFYQEAQRSGVLTGDEYKSQLEQARVGLAVQSLFADFQKKNPVTDAELKSEYDKLKAQSAGTEYRARHILVEKEDEAKSLITQIKGGAKFEDLAKKHSKDSGSGEKGGDLDFAAAGTFVPEFSQAMVKLKKGEMTAEPVKSQFGWHVIRLEDTRDAQFPPFDDVKPQLQQRLSQAKLAKYRDDVRAKAKTDYKFSQ